MKAWLKKVFVPNETNKYAPHSLQKAAVVGMLALVLLTFTLTNVQSLLWIASDYLVSTILPAVIVAETNVARETENLPDLRRSSVLDAAAKLKAEHMAKNEYFAHYSPDGVSPWYWFGQVNYNFVHAGENLAIHFTDSGEVVDAWMNSPTHRANIMNGNYTEIGIGTAEGEYEGFSTVYVVQLFGTPAVAALPVVAGETADEPEAAPEAPVVTTDTTTSPTTAVATSTQKDTVLAETASITETVDIVPATPELVVTTSTPASSTETVVLETVVTDNDVALYSDFVSTSTGGVPATIDPLLPSDGESVPKTLSLLTQPSMVLQLMYGIIGLFVLISLLLSIFIEIRRQQPLQIAYGFALLGLMSGLFYVHAVLTSGVVIV